MVIMPIRDSRSCCSPALPETVRLLLDHGVDPNIRPRDSYTILHHVASHYQAENCLIRGADPVEPDAEPWATPLAWATKRGHQEIVELLRSRGAGA